MDGGVVELGGDAGGGTGGAGAGTAGAGGTGAGAGGAGTGTGTGAGAGTAALSGGAPAAAAATPAWHSSFTPEDIGWLQNKQYFGADLAKADVGQGVLAMVKAHRGMESIMGRNRVALPKDDGDTEGWNQFYTAAGRPADAKAYGLKAPEGGSQEYMDGFAQIAHGEGLSTRQATNLATKWDAFAKEQMAGAKEAAEHRFTTQSAADMDAIRREWGAQFDPKMAAAQRAGHGFNISKETMGKIERAIGTKAMLDMMANIGAAVSEDSGAGGGSDGGTGHLTPEMASAQLAELKNDKPWLVKYQAGDKEAVALFRRLTEAKAAGLPS